MKCTRIKCKLKLANPAFYHLICGNMTPAELNKELGNIDLFLLDQILKGNDIKLKWFRQNSNLHSVWDSRMIDGQQLSYTELANSVNFPSDDEVVKWQSDSILVWANESMSYRGDVYSLPENLSIGYRYNFDNWATVQKRLAQAGVRLAGILNQIYG